MTKIHLQSTYSDIVSDGGLDPRNKYEKMAERHTKALVESMKQTISEHMILAWYDPTNHHVSTDKHDPLFTPLGQIWPLHKIPSPLTDEEIKK